MLNHKFIRAFYVNAQTFYEVFDIRTECDEISRDEVIRSQKVTAALMYGYVRQSFTLFQLIHIIMLLSSFHEGCAISLNRAMHVCERVYQLFSLQFQFLLINLKTNGWMFVCYSVPSYIFLDFYTCTYLVLKRTLIGNDELYYKISINESVEWRLLTGSASYPISISTRNAAFQIGSLLQNRHRPGRCLPPPPIEDATWCHLPLSIVYIFANIVPHIDYLFKVTQTSKQ